MRRTRSMNGSGYKIVAFARPTYGGNRTDGRDCNLCEIDRTGNECKCQNLSQH